jgi:hypothetical protein
MKRLVFVVACLLVSFSGIAQKVMKSEAQLKEKIALACKLTDKDQVKRMNELHQTLFRKVDKAIEHPTSYELVFQKADGDLEIQLAEFIKFERLCCPWLLFQLTFQPENGPISLKMGNSTETKEMVNLVMELDKLEKTHR